MATARNAGFLSVDAVARRMYAAWISGDRAALEAMLTDDFRFTSPYDNELDRSEYFARCWPGHTSMKRFTFDRIVVDGDRVCVTYDLDFHDGHRARNTEWLTFDAGHRLKRAEVFFGAAHGVSASHAPREPDEHARAIEPIIGLWQLTGANAGSPPTPVEGDEHYERLDGGFFVTARWIRRFDGGPHAGVSVLGYEPDRGAIMLHNFDNLGYAREYRVDIAGAIWSLTGSHERATYTFAGDSFTANRERTTDGQTWSPLCSLRATRRT